MENDYFKRVAALTPTKMWINNVTRKEAQMAIDAGAMGCTQNPSYTWKMLTHPEEKDRALGILNQTMKESENDNDVVCIFQRKLIKEISDVFLPLWEKTNGQHGYVSIQGDPIHEHDPQVIINEARLNRDMNPNIMIKIPATKAGLEAMKVLIAENTPLNATELKSVAQVVDLCELYKIITSETKKKPIMYLSLISGIYDEWLQKDVADKNIVINKDILYQAGMVIAKKVYTLMHDRGYELGFIGGGVRGLQHFTEMVGGDVCITMNWSGQVDKLLELDLPVVSRLFNPVQPDVLDTLIENVPQFRQAYMENGLNVEEYEEYGPVKYFWNMFISSWKSNVELVSSLR